MAGEGWLQPSPQPRIVLAVVSHWQVQITAMYFAALKETFRLLNYLHAIGNPHAVSARICL